MKKTGWPAPLLMQDDNPHLSRWFASRPDALYVFKRNNMKHEAHSKHTHKIVDCKIIATWNDGRQEDLSVNLPDYLREQIEQYLDELDDLRTQNPEDYSMEGEIV